MTATAFRSTAPGLEWITALRDPAQVQEWSLAEWDLVVRLARRHRLLARLACAIDGAGLSETVPAVVRRHLLGAQRLSEARSRAVCWAIERLPHMLDEPAFPLVLLKGAAYMGQGLPIAAGRMPSDLDILIPHAKLHEVQLRLAMAGWQEPDLDPQDRHYYMAWSHELPPLQHGRHAVELDVHHNILPPRAGRSIDAALLLERLVPSRWAPWQVLCPVDQVLHSAAHLFHDAEPRDRVRDLVDLDGLFRHFGVDPAFWDDLAHRADTLGLAEPLALACHFTQAWLGTEVPASLRQHLAERGPGPVRLLWLQALMAKVLRPEGPDSTDSWAKRVATTAVLARYHWNRLPLRVLVPHLWRKWRAAGQAKAPLVEDPGQPA